jgi:SAM-dependent methyltransferase
MMRVPPCVKHGNGQPAGGSTINGAQQAPHEANPVLDGLSDAAAEALALFGRVRRARDGWVNSQGGDVASSGSERSLVRHAANYLAAASLAGAAPAGARMVDVGGGVGAFTAWLSDRLGAPATLVDADPDMLRVAAAAFPSLSLAASLETLPDGCAWLVTAMEVVEHVPPAQQEAFVRELARLVAPGGLLVLSTPDESRYLGGWSGYGPHVGVLDADGLERLLGSATDGAARVWRMEGEAFRVGAVERVLLPLANRAVAVARARVPSMLDVCGHAFTRLGNVLPDRPARASHEVSALPPHEGQGSGLLAAVRFA